MTGHELDSVSFDKAKRERLRAAYDAAVDGNVTVIRFEDRDYYVPYVKYLLEYLDGKLGK